MRALILKSSIIASLLLMIALVGAWPTRSDNGAVRLLKTEETAAAEKRGKRTAMTPLSYRSPGSKHKLMIPAEDAELEHQLLSSRAIGKARKYGAYSLVELSDEQLASLSSGELERAQVRDDLNLVLLKRGQLDTTGPSPKISEDLRQPGRMSHALHLVQLFGPPTPDSLSAVKATGVRIVSYIPNNTYLVWATPAQLGRVRSLAGRSDIVQWEGPYHPAYKLDSYFKLDSVEQLPVSIQVIDTQEAGRSLALIKSVARKVLMNEFSSSGIIHIKVLAESNRLAEIARAAEVIAIEPWAEIRLMDERANQIVAGALSVETVNSIQVSRPTSPGYFNFLTSLGFNTQFGFAIDISDTGFDIGSADAAKMHQDFLDGAGASRIAYLNDFSGDSHPADASVLPTHDPAGHGTLNASIAVGFNNKSGAAFNDAQGYSYGLGVAPFARLGVSKLFRDDGRFGNISFSDYITAAYRGGARISSNSWGACDNSTAFCNLYGDDSQAFDSLVRDADADTPGNQGLVILFAAGNDGDTGLPSVAVPGTAKNTISVGLSENVRGTEIDGCGVNALGADNAQDIIDFSGWGPTQDGRTKPDLVAPGSHMQGAASQDKFYASAPANSLGVCNRFFPAGQTLYTWSSGTSHSTPAVAGGAALAYQWLKNHFGFEPSPALVKAFILNSTSYVGGRFGGDNLPGAHQGWGLLNLARMFEQTNRVVYDESPSRTFTQSGGAPFEITGVIEDGSKEVRVMLAYTDAPGSAVTNAPYVNQLNLEVVVNGKLYNGNVFSGQYSKTGGQKDFFNNTQGVRLPAGTTGSFVIRVRPTVIAGDGVPGNEFSLDQDFALVVTNGRETPVPVLALDAVGDVTQGVTVLHSNGSSDTSIIPGEQARITVAVSNKSQTAASGISDFLLSITATNGSKTEVAGLSTYPVIEAGQSGTNATPFLLPIPSDLRCGSVIELPLVLTTPTGKITLPVRVRVGRQIVTGAAVPPLLTDDVDGGRIKWKKKKGFDVANGTAHSGSQSYHVVDPGKVEDDEQQSTLLLKKAITIPANAGNVRLSFFHIFNFEPGFDGGVLEISDDGGDTWQDLGSRILVGGYDGTVTKISDNPLGTRLAWTARGRPGVFSQVVINLDDFAGKKIKLRFTAGFDAASGIRDGYTGWFIDDILITANTFACN